MGDGTAIQWADASGRHDETAYQRSRVRWSQDVWSGRQRDLFAEREGRKRGREFEQLAAARLFPKLGLTEVVDLNGIVTSAPFDFLATFGDGRIAIDVSVKWQKRVDHKEPLATAFGFPFFLLLVCPHSPEFFFFSKVARNAKSVRVPFAILRSIADKTGEAHHGRRH